MDIATAAAVGSSVLSFKGNMQAAKSARQVGEYNAQVAENERVLLLQRKAAEEAAIRRNSNRLQATQRVATATSGIQLSGSPLEALRDAKFNTEVDALRIQYAADVDATAKEAEAAMSRASGRAQSAAYRTAAYGSLLSGASSQSQYQQQKDMFATQQKYYERKIAE